MRHLKVLGVALVAIFALGLTATSALAEITLPDVHILEGTEKYPLHLNFADNGLTPTALHAAAGGVLEGKGVSILTLTNELSALGLFSATFLNVTNAAKEKCNTAGDVAGEVLSSGEFHIVPVNLTTLQFGVAFLATEIAIKCGLTTIHIKGCVLSTLEVANESEVKAIKGALEGDKKGKNTLTKYIDDLGEPLECILLSDFGTGFKQSSEEVGEAVTLEALEKKMFTILNL
ncbi:MAG: hypothetical protein ACHP7P_14040 [Terriglobales bacterium]